ncbi:carbohydrate ABC transporter permease [Cryptosporangium phraense]|uniref:Carbohydrate ABC transporter permease n=1 Tax=Cryptosporangium phraense TaxID=2593070 RepID=A0A545ARV3_9ACTN|nr:carbohydrate ABC transporter permease [Cryptosporangium phraense]TQS43415.1 carbohydrate ABC transporter permease [Cryptosporangium phraense]
MTTTMARPDRVVTSAPPKTQRRDDVLVWIATHAVAIGLALLFVLPIVFLLLTSVMSDRQALDGSFWPTTWQWSNYEHVFRTPGFLVWWRNSLVYAGVGTALTLVSSLFPAIALAKFRFRGANLTMFLVISMMMLPPQVVIVPMYVVWSQDLGLSGSLWPLIIPLAFGDAYSIFLLRQFLLTLPDEVLDAASVDGCGELRKVWHVIVPMARPALVAVGLFQFFALWNDYFGPQIYASENPNAWTLSYGLETFKSAHHSNWNLTLAATALVMLPVVVVFFFAQRAFVRGVTLTGVRA